MESNRSVSSSRTWLDTFKRSALTRSVLNAALLAAWLWLYSPVLAYLGILFTREEFRTNQIILVAIAGLIVLRLRRSGLKLSPAAARRLVLDEMNRSRGQLDELAVLDRMHAVAVANSIITPYSSMIVLVNDIQRRLLDQMNQQGDRFDREVEAVGETQIPSITGVPEPQEWLLIVLAVLLLVYVYRSRKPAASYR